VTGDSLLAEAGPGGSLSDLRFTKDVVYQEKALRRAEPRSGLRGQERGRVTDGEGQTLQLRVTDEGVQSGAFGGGATFEESGLSGSARAIEYDVRRGRLVLAAEARQWRRAPGGRAPVDDGAPCRGGSRGARCAGGRRREDRATAGSVRRRGPADAWALRAGARRQRERRARVVYGIRRGA
jgi:hypothetical protein